MADVYQANLENAASPSSLFSLHNKIVAHSSERQKKRERGGGDLIALNGSDT